MHLPAKDRMCYDLILHHTQDNTEKRRLQLTTTIPGSHSRFCTRTQSINLEPRLLWCSDHCFTVRRVDEIMNSCGDTPKAASSFIFVKDSGSVTFILVFPTDIPQSLLWNHSSSVCVLWASPSLEDLVEEAVCKSGELNVEVGLLDGCSLGKLRGGVW